MAHARDSANRIALGMTVLHRRTKAADVNVKANEAVNQGLPPTFLHKDDWLRSFLMPSIRGRSTP